MRGKMLWFNEVKDLGSIASDDGERLPVRGPSFAGGRRPQGRCAATVVTFDVDKSGREREAVNVAIDAEETGGRARRRSRTVRTF